jgi:hypothetical protein
MKQACFRAPAARFRACGVVLCGSDNGRAVTQRSLRGAAFGTQQGASNVRSQRLNGQRLDLIADFQGAYRRQVPIGLGTRWQKD